MDLLHAFAEHLLIPESVAIEIRKKSETSVLAYAYHHPGTEAIIDDLAGRKCALSLQIPVRGTLGIVLAAKKRGLISQARPVLEHLLRSGLYLSQPILDEALRRVAE